MQHSDYLAYSSLITVKMLTANKVAPEKEPDTHLILNKASGILQCQLIFAHAVVTGGESQTAQSVPASSIFPDHRHELFLDARGQGHLVAAYTDMCAPVDHSLRGTL